MGDIIKVNLHVRRIAGELYSFNGAYYAKGEDPIRKESIDYYANISGRHKSEVIGYIKDTLSDEDLLPSDEYICFNNGLLNLTNWQLEPFTPDIILFNQIPHNYNPRAYDKTVDEALDAWCSYNRELRKLIEEYMGYCMIPITDGQVSLFLNGDGNNGKSTFLELLSDFFGCANCSSFALDELGERFTTIELKGKLVNICNDIQQSALYGKKLSIFKQLVTGDKVKGEIKGGAISINKFYSKLIFSCNGLPSMGDAKSIARRVIVIPFSADFSGKEDRTLGNRIRTESAFEYLARISVEGLHRLIGHGYRFQHSALAEREKERELTHIDTIHSYLDTIETPAEYFERFTKKEINTHYRKFCTDNNKIPAMDSRFSNELKARFNLKEDSRKDINGFSQRVYRSNE